jgi:hypothetical protein
VGTEWAQCGCMGRCLLWRHLLGGAWPSMSGWSPHWLLRGEMLRGAAEAGRRAAGGAAELGRAAGPEAGRAAPRMDWCAGT